MRTHFDETEAANDFEYDADYTGDQAQGGGGSSSKVHDGEVGKLTNNKEEGPA